ncbi:hypothetical protein Cni_G05350 [Canna indica]|uniref:Uncharacterized protein n=1 Tax=Canna indica TaxID=4628 RepID=A0AAQ3JWG1_9LILI|nr:hypothetical protein Cni_G05350 [Canna indica]
MDVQRRLPSRPKFALPPSSTLARKGGHRSSSLGSKLLMSFPSRSATLTSSSLPSLLPPLFSSCGGGARRSDPRPPLHLLGQCEIFVIVGLIALLIYLLSFFGIAFVQSIVSSHDEEEDFLLSAPTLAPAPAAPIASPATSAICTLLCTDGAPASQKVPKVSADDEEIISSVVAGKTPSYVLESKLGDCKKAVGIRWETLRRITRRA